jgi:hypothetical protein
MRPACAGGLLLVALLAGVSSAQAQSSTPRERGRFESSVGAVWWGGYDLGGSSATVPAGSGAASGATLFDAQADIGGGVGLTARFGWRFWRDLWVDGGATFARARLRSTVRSDVEPALNAALDTPFNQLAADAGLLVPLRRAAMRNGRLVPFISGGGGYLRQMYEDGVLLETGRLGYVGGGVRLAPPMRSDRFFRQVGLRADVRLMVRTGGIDVEDSARAFVTLAGGVFVRF